MKYILIYFFKFLFKQKIILIANIKTDNLDENYKKACKELEKIAKLIKTGKKAKKPEKELEKPVFAGKSQKKIKTRKKNRKR